jgi:glycerophosphoryl diester phosphodiesterase
MRRDLIVAGFVVACAALVSGQPGPVRSTKTLIAHRGASAYAPEHTLAAYRLALEHKADFVEPDLAVSRDGVLVCLHDDTLERTTNVEEMFPDRYSRVLQGRGGARRWVANDFTLAELKRLDAGSWMDAKYAGERIPTFQEMIDVVRGRAGIYPELKSPPLYMGRGVDMVKLFADAVRANGLDTAPSLAAMPVITQSFDEATVRRLSRDLPAIPRIFLIEDDADLADARLREFAAFATGIGPNKALIARDPSVVARAHAAGLTVTAWTFRARDTRHPTVTDEMSQFLYAWGIDALFTDNPDLFPRR